MPLASMRSNNLGGSATGPPKSLYIDGLDVLKQPGTATNRYGVPIETCEITEAGPGGISALSFVLEDPSISLPSPTEGQWVRFQDHTNDRPIFLGFVQDWATSVFGLGRAFAIDCIGIEAVLDWMVIPVDMTFAAASQTPDDIQSLCAVATGIGVPLRTARAASSANSSQDKPIGSIDPGAITTFGTLQNAVTVTAGTTLREGIRQLTDQNVTALGFRQLNTSAVAVTVDFYSGVRAFFQNQGPSDYTALTINDVVAGPLIAANLAHEVDSTGIVRQVYVKGGNAAGSGVVGDGSGAVGPVNTLDDSSITTAADRDARGFAYLSDKHSGIRGSFDLESYNPTTNVRSASLLTITDVQLGLAAYSTFVAEIHRRFLGSGKEDWSIQYGGLRPSFANAVRRLTRSTRS